MTTQQLRNRLHEQDQGRQETRYGRLFRARRDAVVRSARGKLEVHAYFPHWEVSDLNAPETLGDVRFEVRS